MTRWIAERLGTSPWGGCEHGVDTAVVDVRALRDASGNPPAVIRDYIDTAVAHWREGRTVVICCDYGVSRSNAVAAGALSVLTGRSYDATVAEVIAATGEQQIKLDFAMDVRVALEEPPRDSNNRGIVVIGSEGFLGRALTRALADECTGCSDADGASLSASPVLLDAQLGHQAPARLLCCWHPPQLDTNVAAGRLITGLRNVLEVCRLRGIGIVFISGHQVFAARNDQVIYRCTEDEELKPAGAAGDGLYLAEQLVRVYASRHGVDALVVRPTHLYGPGDERPTFLNTFMRKALAGSEIDTHHFVNGAPSVDVLHVDDFARGVVLAIRNGMTGVLHLASGDFLSSGELAGQIVRIAGSGSRIRGINLPAQCSHNVLDASRARSILGWKPEIPLAEGLRDVLAHIKINTVNKIGSNSK